MWCSLSIRHRNRKDAWRVGWEWDMFFDKLWSSLNVTERILSCKIVIVAQPSHSCRMLSESKLCVVKSRTVAWSGREMSGLERHCYHCPNTLNCVKFILWLRLSRASKSLTPWRLLLPLLRFFIVPLHISCLMWVNNFSEYHLEVTMMAQTFFLATSTAVEKDVNKFS